MRSMMLICLGLCTTLLFFAELDGEVGDHHADRLKRRAYSISLYMSIRDFSHFSPFNFAFRYALLLLIIISLSMMAGSSSRISFLFGVVAWTIMAQFIVGGIHHYRRPHPVKVVVSEHQAMLSRVDKVCKTWGNGSIDIGLRHATPSLRVLERAAYYLGGRWSTYSLPTHRRERSSIPSKQVLPMCFEEYSHIDIENFPVCFSLQRWDGDDGDEVLSRLLRKNGLSASYTTFERLLYHRYTDLVTLADTLREVRSWQALGVSTVPMRFGDGFLEDESLAFPVLVPALSIWPRDAAAATLSPSPEQRGASVLWPMNWDRYFGSLFQVLKNDVMPFAHKRNLAIWRGVTTGDPNAYGRPKGQKHLGRPIQRAALVRRLAENSNLWGGNTSVLDVGVTKYVQGAREKLVEAGFLPVEEVTFLSDAQVLSAKMIIIAEGNDASTGLKWALCSTSAVLMPPPTVMTWIMEDQLEPWVHYIPLAQDFSDLEEKAIWCLSNLPKCEAVGIAGQCFMRQFMDEHVEHAVEHVVLQRVVAELENIGSNFGSVCDACIGRVHT